MAQQPPLKLQQLLDKAASDPAFLQQLSADPLGAAKTAGVQLDATHLKALLGMPQASDAELVDTLRARVSHAATSCSSCHTPLYT